MVAGQQYGTGAHSRKPLDHLLSLRAQTVGQGDHANILLPVCHQNQGFALGAQFLQNRYCSRGEAYPIFPQKCLAAAEQTVPLPLCPDSFTGIHVEDRSFSNCQVFFFGTAYNGLAQRVLAPGFCAGGQGEQFVLTAGRLKTPYIADLQFAAGQRAGFIKGNRVHLAHLFQCFAGFDHDTMFGGLADGRHDRSRGCQNQSTGAEHDQHGHSGNDITAEQVGQHSN